MTIEFVSGTPGRAMVCVDYGAYCTDDGGAAASDKAAV